MSEINIYIKGPFIYEVSHLGSWGASNFPTFADRG